MKIQKYIIISLLLFLSGTSGLFAQQRQVVTGKVYELLSNGQKDPVIGCNINVVNKDNRSVGGTVTNIDGVYILQIPANEQNLTLEFSFIGLITHKVKYTGQRTLDVTLEPKTQELMEVEITTRRLDRNDMGVSRQGNVGANQKIEMDEIVSSIPVLSIEEALQGRLGGVDITIGGGDPGARSAIRIRGTSTLTASAEPLIVIDGVPYNTTISEDFDFSTANNEDFGALLNISPTDIESVEVLKDAASTAIWGTKGANGVLLITTKRGKAGKTSFSFSSKFTAKEEPRTIPMLNGNQYVALMQEAIWNSANYEGLGTNSPYLAGLFGTKSIGYDPDWKYFREYNQNTDWLDEIRKTALSWDNNFSMSGGGDRATYRFSLGYLNEGGTTIGTGLNRLNTSLVINYKFSNKFTFGADFAYSQSDKKDNYAGSGNLRGEAFRKMPNKSPYYIDPATDERSSTYFSLNEAVLNRGGRRLGGIDDAFNGNRNYNPVAMANESYNNSTIRDSKITFRIDYYPLPGLTYKGWISVRMNADKNRKFLPQEATGVVLSDDYSNRSTDAYSSSISLQFSNQLTYVKNWDKHKIVATLRSLTSQAESSNYTSQTAGNVSSSLSDPIIGNKVVGMGSGPAESRGVSGSGLLNYGFLDRYYIQGSVTVEGSSAMGKNHRMGYFPAAGITYNMHNEPYLRDLSWLEEAKFRASLGQSGNAPSGSSIYLGAFSAYDPYMDMPGVHPNRMQLNNLRWETSTDYNFGTDMSFFKGKLSFTFDYYEKYTTDLLQKDVDVPSTTGYPEVPRFNSGEMSNKGWEFRTDFTVFQNKDWRISANVNFSRNINEVIKLPQHLKDSVLKFRNGEYQTIVIEGRPVGSFYGLKYKGVYKNKAETYALDADGKIMNDINGNPIITQIIGDNGAVTVMPGDAKYEDINNDGVIDKYDIVYLGSCIPIVTGGGGFTIRYKQLTLNAFFHGRFGQKVINQVRMQNEAMYNGDNQSTAVLRRWRNEGDETDIPRALFGIGYNYVGSDRFVEDASYLRLKTLSLNYSVPRKTLQKIGFNSMVIFITGYDLLTFTKYTGQNPEINPPAKAHQLAKDGANTPVPMRLSCGINVGF